MCNATARATHSPCFFSEKPSVNASYRFTVLKSTDEQYIYNAHSLILTWLLWADWPSAGEGDRFGFFISWWMMDSESGKVTADVPSDQRGPI